MKKINITKAQGINYSVDLVYNPVCKMLLLVPSDDTVKKGF